MQVGFSPVNIKNQVMNQSNRQHGLNFGAKIPVKLSASQPMEFAEAIGRGAHEDSKENRGLLKEVVKRIEKVFSDEAPFDIPEIKSAIFKKWGQDNELKEIFKGY